jgi:hypothetical protein
MGAIKGRAKRVIDRPVALVQARVATEVHVKAHQAAKALGISLAEYVEQLIAHDTVDDDGRPVWWPATALDGQEELPLQQSA